MYPCGFEKRAHGRLYEAEPLTTFSKANVTIGETLCGVRCCELLRIPGDGVPDDSDLNQVHLDEPRNRFSVGPETDAKIIDREEDFFRIS